VFCQNKLPSTVINILQYATTKAILLPIKVTQAHKLVRAATFSKANLYSLLSLPALYLHTGLIGNFVISLSQVAGEARVSFVCANSAKIKMKASLIHNFLQE